MAKTKTQTLSLGEYWNDFIELMIKSHRYASASELVRESLRLLEEQEAHSTLTQLRAALIEGEDSGDAGEWNLWKIKQAVKKEVGLDKKRNVQDSSTATG